MASLLLLGTGSGSLNPERNASAYLFQMTHGDILLDAGEPVAATLRRRAYDWSRLLGIVITHAHADHLGGLPMLVQQLYLSRRTNPLSLYGPPEYIERFREHWGMHYLLPEAMSFEVTADSLREGEVLHAGGAHIHPYPTGHLLPARDKVSEFGYPNRCEAFALRVSTGDAAFCYSGDVNSFDDLRAALPGCGLAVIDSTHVDLDSVLEWAHEVPQTRIILSHIATDFDPARLAAGLTKSGLSNVEVAVDGLTVSL